MQRWQTIMNHASSQQDVMIKTAEILANKIVKQGGELYATGVEPFWREAVHRAGGLSMIRQWTPLNVLDKNDVVLLGLEYQDFPTYQDYAISFLNTGATVVLFAEPCSEADTLLQQYPHDQFIHIPCLAQLDGLFESKKEKRKFGSLTGMHHILNYWLLMSELVSAMTRLNAMPNILVSITHPKGWSLNGKCVYSRFYQDGEIHPVLPGVLFKQYMEQMNTCLEFDSELIKKAVDLMLGVLYSKGSIKEQVAGHWASYLPKNQYTPPYLNTTKDLIENDLCLNLDYNYYDIDMNGYLNKSIKVIYMLTSSKRDEPFKGILPTVHGHLLPLIHQIPDEDQLIVIPANWHRFDGCLILPDFPYPFCASSWIAHGWMHWKLIEQLTLKYN
jgi:hypothetical protein